MGIISTSRLGVLTIVSGGYAGERSNIRQQQQKPNVIFILADNVGYGDLVPYGGGEELRTAGKSGR